MYNDIPNELHLLLEVRSCNHFLTSSGIGVFGVTSCRLDVRPEETSLHHMTKRTAAIIAGNTTAQDGAKKENRSNAPCNLSSWCTLICAHSVSSVTCRTCFSCNDHLLVELFFLEELFGYHESTDLFANSIYSAGIHFVFAAAHTCAHTLSYKGQQ